jgi:hypothetical protein
MNNSNNRPLGWTTLKESKQLIEAGLPVETADMRYSFIGEHIKEATENDYLLHTGSVDKDSYTFKHKFLIPCWSLGVLTQLLPRTIEQEYNLLINSEFYVMYRHPFSKDVKFVCSKSSFLIENVKDAIIWLLNNKML